MIKYYIICEQNGYVIKDYYRVDSAKDALELFEKNYGEVGFELIMLFKGE